MGRSNWKMAYTVLATPTAGIGYSNLAVPVLLSVGAEEIYAY